MPSSMDHIFNLLILMSEVAYRFGTFIPTLLTLNTEVPTWLYTCVIESE